MPRLVTAVIALTAAIALGCGKGSGRPVAAAVDALPTIQPASGGDMVLIPSGTFTMGDAAGRPDETPHTVTVDSLYVDKYPVTQELYERIMGVNPSKRKDPKNPVEKTQWTDAVLFCNKCSKRDGLPPCYDTTTWECRFDAGGYRLPTEAEWEYVCRAGSTGKFCFGDAEADLPKYAWLKPHSQGKPHPVGQKQPNRWGLYDVHGNVWQWCNDWYAEDFYAKSPPLAQHGPPTPSRPGPATGTMRVLRGGAWDSTPDKCRAAYRHKEFPVYSDACFGADSYGFRRVRAVQPSANPGAVVDGPPAVSFNSPYPKDFKPKAVVAPPGSGKLAPATLKGTIVFVSDRSGPLKIWTMHASGEAAKQLTHGNDADADPRFSPDGKRILYTTLRGGFPEVWTMNRDGSESARVTAGSQASWSPDGQSIVFIRDDQAFVRALATGKEKLITPKAWDRCGVPSFSPDGKRIAVASRHLGTVGIFVLGEDGSDARPLKSDEPCCTPRWSKDGNHLLCQTVQGHICQAVADGTGWEQLTYGADVQHDACYSPDGTMILFCRAPAPEGPWQICVQRLAGPDDEFVPLTKLGSNSLPDWHATE
jgi:sulfatase modifying factor 1